MTAPVVIPKNSREVYKVAWEEFEGNRFLDLRVYYTDAKGELKPTRKGLAIKPSAIPEIVAALTALGGGE